MKPDAYTLGNPRSYEEYLDRDSKPEKLGREDDMAKKDNYEGGCVFKTKEEAQVSEMAGKYGYRPYGLILPSGWDEDVDDSNKDEEGFSRLIHNARIVRV